MSISANQLPIKFTGVKRACGAIVACWSLTVAVSAEVTFTTLYDFPGGPSRPSTSLVLGTDENFYGTTSSGGNGPGTVYKITSAGAVTTLYRFTGGLDGSLPSAALLRASDGNFYGTTQSGGTSGVLFSGTVFKITPAGVLTTLYNFDGSKGMYPGSGLVEGADGNFYGTVETGKGGETTARGGVFKMTPAGALTIIHSFTGQADGSNPKAALLRASDGNFYGTTTFDGSGEDGTIFCVTPAGKLSTLHSFVHASEGRLPVAALIEASDGDLYGTTSDGGVNGFGTVFKISKAGTFTVLHTFSFPAAIDPIAALLEGSDGNFYGTTRGGGSQGNNGTVFRMTPAGVLTLLYEFTDGDDGTQPAATLIDGGDGYFYGTTNLGAVGSGRPGGGTVFKITPAGALTTIFRFHSAPVGTGPNAALVQTADGNFFGTTAGGGTSGNGTFFKMAPPSGFTSLHSFTEETGAEPVGLVRGGDGFFYGTLASGGAFNWGAIFKMSPAGAVSTLHNFTGEADGGSPAAPLILGSDGNLYGTTNSDAGTVFKINTSGVFTTLHSFTGATAIDGYGPAAALVEGKDGNFYGTTEFGGMEDNGTVFRIAPGGQLTVLHRFTGDDVGIQPSTGLTQGTDGDFYGTTRTNATTFRGSIFKITAAGAVTNLHSFAGGDEGTGSPAALIQAKDGNFYGVADGGSTFGTIFRMTPAGTLTTLYRFAFETDGADPIAPLVQLSDGSFYGTASCCGPSDNGTVFRLVVTSPPTITSFLPTGGLVGSSVTILGTNFSGTTAVQLNGVAASFTVESDTQIVAVVPAGASTGLIAVTNGTGAGTSSSNFTVLSDSDGDGMPDNFERLYFGDPTAGDSAADGDGDGETNRQEYVAGTHPLDHSSVFRMTEIRRQGNDIVVVFVARAGKRYRVVAGATLKDGFPFAIATIAPLPSNSVREVPDAGGTLRLTRFYRAMVLP